MVLWLAALQSKQSLRAWMKCSHGYIQKPKCQCRHHWKLYSVDFKSKKKIAFRLQFPWILIIKLIFIIRLILHKCLNGKIRNYTKDIFLQVRQGKLEYKAAMVSPLEMFHSNTIIFFFFWKETEPKGWKWGLLSWELEGGEKHPQTSIPSGPFRFRLVQNRKRDSDRRRKGVYSPWNTVK